VLTDSARLEAFIRSKVPGLTGAMSVERVRGGQSNPTFFITFENTRFVLRKKPAGVVLPSAHAVDREYRVLGALGRIGLPVPEVVLYYEQTDVLDTPFYIMERIDGRIFADSELAAAPRGDRARMYESAATTLAAIHRVDYEAAGLSSFGKHGKFFSRQIRRWTQQWDLSRSKDIPEIDVLAKWLPNNLPEDIQTTVVHGDFRIGNLIFHPIEPRVIGVLDWELSTLGHPMADLAHTCVYSWYVKAEEYGGILGLDLAHRGLPSLDEFCAAYYSASGQEERLGAFHLVLALFRNAVIFEGIASRARAGNASSKDAAVVGELAPVFARRAVALIDRGT
jgi:aminoglycoside phosphotransferase (APT) family kinase protein